MPYVWLDKRTEPEIYRFNYRDSHGRKRSGTGTTSKAETVKLAAHVQAKENAVRQGWAEAPKPSTEAKKRAFEEVFKEYLSWGEAQGGRGGRPWSSEHARVRKLWLEWWEKNLNLLTLADLQNVLPSAEKALRKLLDNKKAGKTVQNCAETLRAFCRWAKKRGYMDVDPMEGLARFDCTPKSTRRALTADEIQRLLDKCAPHRRLLYEVAFTTGLRRGELRSLTVEHLDVKNKGLLLDASWTKNRRATFHPLPGEIVSRLVKAVSERQAEQLYQRIAEERSRRGAINKVKAPKNPLLYVPEDTARELDRDLERAKIKKDVAGLGKIDFHALRVSYVTFVIEAGANVKEAQTLARHATPNLTLNVYARARSERLSAVTELVGNVVLRKNAKPLVNTITDDKEPVSDSRCGLPLAYRPNAEGEPVCVSVDTEKELQDLKMAERVGFEPT